MTCSRCNKPFSSTAERCPYCGEPRDTSTSGVFQSSTVLISSGGTDLVYRSVEEVPPPLRTRLLKSTNGANSGTILIADRRGREEITRAMRSLPGPVQRKLLQAVVGNQGRESRFRLTPARRAALGAPLVAALAALVWFLFARR
jgi:hypothetical protein